TRSVGMLTSTLTPASCSGKSIFLPWQDPPWHLSGPWLLPSADVHASWSSQPLPSSGTHVEPLHFAHSGQLCAAPAPPGLPPQCQPPLRIHRPGSERSTVPSSLTVAVPVATKLPMSWSNE